MQVQNQLEINPETAISQNHCYVPLILEGTSACKMRDELLKARSEKRINLKEITDKLSKLEIPKWLQSEILQMSNHRKYDRITCPVEQAMESAVAFHILKEIMNDDGYV